MATTVDLGVLESFIPGDRRLALAEGRELPLRVRGAGLFADISGFTPLTESLTAAHGPQRGAEELDRVLNAIYTAVIDDLVSFGGEVLYFSGDAITCWLDGDDGSRATQCALDMQRTLRDHGTVDTPVGPCSLSIKIAVAVGEASRFVVGDPALQRIDVLAGRLVDDLATAESQAEKGDVVADDSVLRSLGDRIVCTGLRVDTGRGARWGFVTELRDPPNRLAVRALPPIGLDDLRPWLLPEVVERLSVGGDRFLGELRNVHSIFVRFGGFDFDHGPEAVGQLDRFVREVQHALGEVDGTLLGITVGDKGAYLLGVVGALRSHEDDSLRAVRAALAIRDLEARTHAVGLQVGVAVGQVYCGSYGHPRRRTYSVLGDPANLAARLMGKAPAGEVYVSEEVAQGVEDRFEWAELPPLTLKGKALPVRARGALTARHQPAQRVRRYPLPMVGRDRELAVARASLDRLRSSKDSVLLVEADAGMGKSRFVAEVLRDAAGRGVPVVYGQAEALSRTASYLPWRSIWRELLGVDEERSEAEQIRDLERALHDVDPALVPRAPLLDVVLGLPIPDNDVVTHFDAKLRKTSLESLLADVLVHLLTRPLVIVLEDVQWADALSLDLLDAVVRRTAGLPVLYLLSCRPDRSEGLRTITEWSSAELLRLTELDDVGIGQVVSAKTEQIFGGGATASGALLSLVLERSQGNPFYAEELVNYVRRLGLDPSDDDAVGRMEVPDSLNAIVLSRIDAMEERPRQGLKVASILGREFRADAVGEVHGSLGDRSDVLRHLEACRADDLLVPEDDELVDWLFRHAITREVAYESIPHAVRAPLHERAGDVLASVPGTPLDVLAHHYWHSENDDQKRRYLRLAGDAARATYANEAAIGHYERLVTLLHESEQSPVLLALAGVLDLVGEWGRAEASAERARQLAEDAGDDSQAAWAEVSLAETARKQGRLDDAVALLARAGSTFERGAEAAGTARVFHLQGTIAAQRGDLVEARRRYEASRDLREAIADVSGLAAILSNLGIVAEYEGRIDDCARHHAEALWLRREIGDRWAVGNSSTNLGMAAMMQRRFGEARELFEESMRLNVEVGDTWHIALAHHNLANAHRDLGDADAARRHYREALATFDRYHDRWALAFLVEDVALLAAPEGPELALGLLAAAERMREEIDAARPPSLEEELSTRIRPHIDHLDPEQRDVAREAGRALDYSLVVRGIEGYCREPRVHAAW